jgi:Flp pilus assembly pilin Flp
MLSILLRLLRDKSGATKLEHTLITLLTAWAALQLFSFLSEKAATW